MDMSAWLYYCLAFGYFWFAFTNLDRGYFYSSFALMAAFHLCTVGYVLHRPTKKISSIMYYTSLMLFAIAGTTAIYVSLTANSFGNLYSSTYAFLIFAVGLYLPLLGILVPYLLIIAIAILELRKLRQEL
jgi:hypothetical protein